MLFLKIILYITLVPAAKKRDHLPAKYPRINIVKCTTYAQLVVHNLCTLRQIIRNMVFLLTRAVRAMIPACVLRFWSNREGIDATGVLEHGKIRGKTPGIDTSNAVVI